MDQQTKVHSTKGTASFQVLLSMLYQVSYSKQYTRDDKVSYVYKQYAMFDNSCCILASRLSV